MIDLRFYRAQARWLGAGFTLALASNFGQTFFISLFAGVLQDRFGLTHGGWGTIYTVGTLASAAAIIFVGKYADQFRIRTIAILVLIGYGVACLAMASVASIAMLVVCIFGLRFCGQGMMTHTTFTAMARWYSAQRGKAVAIAAMGYPVGEALLPLVGVGMIAWVGWRSTWAIAAMILLLIIAPLIYLLLRQERTPQSLAEDETTAGVDGRHWQRGQVLRDPLFWMLLPGMMAPPLIMTIAFFHQVHLTTVKGWDMTAFAASYPAFAITGVVGSFIGGALVDRYGVARLLPYYLLPMCGGLLALGLSSHILIAPLALGLFGITGGLVVAVLGTLWAELYGTRHIGSIRSLISASTVFSTAIGPGLTGLLIDLGIGLETQFLFLAVYSAAVSALFMWVGRIIVARGRTAATLEPAL